MGDSITIASTILLGFGTILAIPNTYETYQLPNYEMNCTMSEYLTKNNTPSFNIIDSEIFQISVLNTNESIVNELSSFIHSIVDNSKSLDADISNFVSEHFWELV